MTSASLVATVKRWTPPALFPIARTVYHRIVAPIECWGVEAADRLLSRTYEGRVLPPALLRFKVRGSSSGDAFAQIGRDCAKNIDATLRTFGRDLASNTSILDFDGDPKPAALALAEIWRDRSRRACEPQA